MGWYKLVKEEVLAGDDHITVKKKGHAGAVWVGHKT